MNILITGGAGFIGTHLSRRLVAEGYKVTVLDNFSPQIHGSNKSLDKDLVQHVRLISGSVEDRATLAAALEKQQVVVHLAAETGTGQSMYEITRYQEVNLGGTACLLDLIVNERVRFSEIQKLVVASSRAIYGEGRYQCPEHGVVHPQQRISSRMTAGQFEPTCPKCGADCKSIPTDELSPASPSSFYGLTKRVQEEMVLLFARTLGISGIALRYQNVYGPGQSLKNPYTGILAVFSNLARANEPINIFEDGLESRDFVYIDDVVDATTRCIQSSISGVDSFNVGSGAGTSVMEVAQQIVNFFDSKSKISVSGAFRLGDIRHNIADLTKVAAATGFSPRWSFDQGLREFLKWASGETVDNSGYQRSLNELRSKGLMHG